MKNKFSLPENLKQQVAKDRQEIADIISGKDKRLLFIVGPCSAWPTEAVIDYAKKLKIVNRDVKSFLKIILRVYTQKPRTIGGWNGLLLEPDPFMPPNPKKGLEHATNLMKKIIKIGLPIADEALFLRFSMILSDYLSWVAIGARSSEEQEHRCFASEINMPTGIKNPTSGSVQIGVNSVLAAQSRQISFLDGCRTKTKGNLLAHLVLRGGQEGLNCQEKNLKLAIRLLNKNNIKNTSIVIDASHGNCVKQKVKDHNIQVNIVLKTLKLIQRKPELRKYVKGFMIESFLKDGSQDLDKNDSMSIDRSGLSITDPCLSWNKTKKLIFEIVKNMSIPNGKK